MSNEKSNRQVSSDDLRRIIALQQREIRGQNERLRGVEELTRILHESEEKRQNLQTKSDNYENALRRAEARVAYLQKKLGIGPQSTFDIDVVSPGISRKDFDVVTKENIRLKEALEHIVPTELGGKDVAIKNLELYELVSTLRDDLAQSEHHIKELEATLAGKQDDLAVKVSQLTKQNNICMALECEIQAKQKYAEDKNKVIAEQGTKIQELLAKIENLFKRISELSTEVVKMNEAKQKTDVSNQELRKTVEEKDKVVFAQNAKIQELLTKDEGKEKEVEKTKEAKRKAEHELSETRKKCSDFQKKCAGFLNQVASLNSKQQESEEEISSLKRACENLRAQLAEKEAMMVMMRDSLNMSEDDIQELQQEIEFLRDEIQSHMATIRHLRSENRFSIECPLCSRRYPSHLIGDHIQDCMLCEPL